MECFSTDWLGRERLLKIGAFQQGVFAERIWRYLHGVTRMLCCRRLRGASPSTFFEQEPSQRAKIVKNPLGSTYVEFELV